MRFRIFRKENVQGNESKAEQLISFLGGCYGGNISIISPIRYPWNTKDMKESDNSLWLWYPISKKINIKLPKHWRYEYDEKGTGLMRKISKSYSDWDTEIKRNLKIMDYFRELDKENIPMLDLEGLEITPGIMGRRIGDFQDISQDSPNSRLSDILTMHKELFNPFYTGIESEFNSNTMNNLHIFTGFNHIWEKGNGSVRYQGLFHFDGKQTYLTNIILHIGNPRIPEKEIGQIPKWEEFIKGEILEDSFYIKNVKIINPSTRLEAGATLNIIGEDDKGKFTGCTHKPGYEKLHKIEDIAERLIDLDLNKQEKEEIEITFPSETEEEPKISEGIEEEGGKRNNKGLFNL